MFLPRNAGVQQNLSQLKEVNKQILNVKVITYSFQVLSKISQDLLGTVTDLWRTIRDGYWSEEVSSIDAGNDRYLN